MAPSLTRRSVLQQVGTLTAFAGGATAICNIARAEATSGAKPIGNWSVINDTLKALYEVRRRRIDLGGLRLRPHTRAVDGVAWMRDLIKA